MIGLFLEKSHNVSAGHGFPRITYFNPLLRRIAERVGNHHIQLQIFFTVLSKHLKTRVYVAM